MNKILKSLSIIVLVGAFAAVLIGWFVNAANSDTDIHTRFEQKMDERTAFYDKLWKIIAQKGQVAKQNDTSFKQVVQIIMDGRKDQQGLAMKWVQEANPAANFDQVSSMYKDLSRAIEANREGFFEQEKVLQDIQREDKNIHRKFPSSLIMSLLGRKELEYKPITSDRTDEVIKTGKDNNVQVF